MELALFYLTKLTLTKINKNSIKRMSNTDDRHRYTVQLPTNPNNCKSVNHHKFNIPFWVPQIHDPDWTDLYAILMVSAVPLHRFCWHRERRNLHPIEFLATVFCDNFK